MHFGKPQPGLKSWSSESMSWKRRVWKDKSDWGPRQFVTLRFIVMQEVVVQQRKRTSRASLTVITTNFNTIHKTSIFRKVYSNHMDWGSTGCHPVRARYRNQFWIYRTADEEIKIKCLTETPPFAYPPLRWLTYKLCLVLFPLAIVRKSPILLIDGSLLYYI